MVDRETGTSIEKRKIQPMLIVYCGPMFSGKSDELIRGLVKAPHAGFKVIAFAPERDDRRGEGTINSENGASYPATIVKHSSAIQELVGPDIDIVGIDEGQFFDEGLIEVCLKLVSMGKQVRIAGLDKDFRGEPFGPMTVLKQEAEHVETFHAYCTVCREDASFTQRIKMVDGKKVPAHYSDTLIQVGAKEAYEARCRRHHIVPGRSH